MQIDPCPGERYCSVVARAVKEDPIGSAWAFGRALIVEVPLPWSYLLTESPALEPGLAALLNQARTMKVGVMLIAPDPDYSVPGSTRLFWVEKLPGAVSGFSCHEYLVSAESAPDLAAALLMHPERVADYQPYIVDNPGRQELMVCTHGSVDVCCGKFGYPIYRELRDAYGTDAGVRVWRVSHFGGHRFAPTLLELPTGRFWGFVEPQHLETLVHRRLPVAALRACYRGCAAMETREEQVAEREAFMLEGWEWDTFQKASTVVGKTGGVTTVRIEYRHEPSGRSGAYEFDVAVAGEVLTLGKSGGDRAPVEQFSVRGFRHMALT